MKHAKPTTVLVVEDEPTVRALAESIIEALGYLILSAANAREAIALLEQDEPIDILFTDINLPDGPDAIDGLELARKVSSFARTCVLSTQRATVKQMA
jgi:CheY-like chemotaxis protein